MKELITKVTFRKEIETKFGTMYSFAVSYDDKSGIYTSKYKDQRKFVEGQEAEFTEEEKEYKDKDGNSRTYTVIKPIQFNKQSNFGKALTREKSKYSGFAVSYAKDLLVAGRIDKAELPSKAWELFNLMVEMDKTLEA